MNDSLHKNSLVLTAAEVRRWKEECSEIDSRIEKLHMDKKRLLDKIAAAELLAPSLSIEQEISKASDGAVRVHRRKGRATWTSLIEEQVRSSLNGILQKDLLDQMRSGPYGERLKASESGYYNAIQKLLKRDILVKRGDYLFTKAQHDEYLTKLDAGEVHDVAEEAKFGSPSAAAMIRYVRENPNGAKSIDLIKAVWKVHEGEHPPSKTSLYNTIARLVEQKHFRRADGKIWPYNENEPPSELDGSDADEVTASSEDNRQRLTLVG